MSTENDGIKTNPPWRNASNSLYRDDFDVADSGSDRIDRRIRDDIQPDITNTRSTRKPVNFETWDTDNEDLLRQSDRKKLSEKHGSANGPSRNQANKASSSEIRASDGKSARSNPNIQAGSEVPKRLSNIPKRSSISDYQLGPADSLNSKRRPIATIAAVSVILVFGGAFASLYQSANQKSEFLVAKINIVSGSTITRGDLETVALSPARQLVGVPDQMINSVIGKQAVTDIGAGALLSPSDFSTPIVVKAGSAIVGLALKAGQIPAEGLLAGELVNVVYTSPAGSQLSQGQPLSSSSLAFGGVQNSSTALGSAGTQPLNVSTDNQLQPPYTIAELASQGPGIVIASSVAVTQAIPESAQASQNTFMVSVDVPENVSGLIAAASTAGQVALVRVGPNNLPPLASGIEG